jgi:amino acid adenylation domain-containing protein
VFADVGLGPEDADTEAHAPLASYAQQVIWSAERMGDGGPAHHMALAIWFHGPLDVAALLGACNDVVARHPVLASVVVEGAEGELYLGAAATGPSVTFVEDPVDDLDRLLREEIARVFDLRKGPLCRFALIAIPVPARHVLLFVAHRLVFDGGSKDILVRELAGCYAARITGRPVPPAPRRPAFAAAVAAERDRVADLLPEARAFWRERWHDPAEIVLPGQGRAARPAAAGDAVQLAVDDDIRQGVAGVAAALDVRPPELLLAALHTLLHRYGDARIAVAVGMPTRTPETRELIGPFVNELPVISRPAPDLAFRAFAHAILGELRDLYRFREIPPGAAGGGVAPPAAATPVTMSYLRHGAGPGFLGLDASVEWSIFAGGARNALHVQWSDGPGGLELSLQFDPGAIARPAVTRIAAHLQTLLRAIAAGPDTALADLEIMPAAERRRLLVDWNATRAAYPPDATLPGLVAAQVRARPDAVAVTYEDRSLSYARLCAAAGRLARRLRRAGAGRGALVAVHLRRSDAMLAGLLAVLEAGAAYLPLDPRLPAERLAAIVADARPLLALTQADLPPLPLPGGQGAAPIPSLVIDDAVLFAEPPGHEGDDDPGSEPAPADLAYVGYGSTGGLEGIEVEHRNLVNLLLALRDRLDAGERDAWLALAPLSAGVAAVELFLPLAVGGRVVIAPDGAERRPAALARLVTEQGVTHVQATPDGWRRLLAGGVADRAVTALTGGGPLPRRLADDLRERAHGLVHGYGPAEATIWSTVAEPVDDLTIGRPLANVKVYVLDDRMKPVPVGVAGELYIGGAGVARGYRGRPARTAARFVPDPFGPPGARLFRTGDRVRYRPDGEAEFLGSWGGDRSGPAPSRAPAVPGTADARGPHVPQEGRGDDAAAGAGTPPSGRSPAATPITPRPDGVAPPLSYAQERLWHRHRNDPEDAADNLFMVRRLRGPLDVPALCLAIDAVAARHETLRTSFAAVGGRPVAVAEPPGPVPVEHLDLTGGAPGRAEADARRLVAERTNAPFDLSAGPPFRATIIGLGPADHVLCVVLHNIIADGWSLNVLFDDLAALYLAHFEHRPPRLPPLPLQYGDVALWQRSRASDEAAAAALAYWRRQLADPPALRLPALEPYAPEPPTDRPGGGAARARQRRAESHAFRVPRDVVATIERVARRRRTTFFAALVTAYQILLSRHTGQADILVGTRWAARDHVELEPMIGHLTDTLVLRGDLSGDPTFADRLGATHRALVDARAHRAAPFERLIAELGPPGDAGWDRVPATMVVLNSPERDAAARARIGAGLSAEPFDAGFRQAGFDIALEGRRDDAGLTLSFTYDAARFDAGTIGLLAARLQGLLAGIAADPEARISALPMPPAAGSRAVADRTGARVTVSSGTGAGSRG